VIPFHGVQTSYTARVDETFHFRATDLPYGTYAVRFDGLDLPSAPAGSFRFDGTVTVDRGVVTWSGAAPLVPVVIDVKVNGQPMVDDTLLSTTVVMEPRGALVFSRDEDTRFTLSLGETGPARFERLMLPGRYQAAVDSRTYYGRTFIRGYEQDVLPSGRLELGFVDVGAHAVAAGSGPVRLDFDLPVRVVRVRVAGAELVTTSGESHALVRLTSDAGHPFWAVYPAEADNVPVRVYGGCYAVHVLPSMAPYYPDSPRIDGVARVGDLCTCDAPGGTPDAGSGGG
jgi:hypothetical protein